MPNRLLRRTSVAGAALVPLAAMAVVMLPPDSAFAGSTTFSNACRNSINSNWDQIKTTMYGTAPTGPVKAGSTVTLSNLGVKLAVPGAIFVVGYNLNLLHTGVNTIPATVNEVIDATNTVQGSQSTGVKDLPPGFVTNATLTTKISDPDGVKSSGDETATPGVGSAMFKDMKWTAKAAGPIRFSEHNDTSPPMSGVTGGGLTAVAHLVDGQINAQFHCTSGTVAGSNPGVPTLTNAPAMNTSKDATGLALTASATRVKKGTTVRFTGRLQDLVTKAYVNGQTVTLQRRLRTSGAWQNVTSKLTKTVSGKKGTVVFALKVARSFYYDLNFKGTSSYKPSRSRAVHVVVK